MGYSCTAAAAYTLEALTTLLALPTSNGTPDGGFFERGRENASGAITGMVWKPHPRMPGHVTRRGGFHIDHVGKVHHFPGVPRALWARAEAMARETYERNHDPVAYYRRMKALADAHDGICPGALFTVYSDDNPHVAALNEAAARVQAMRGAR